jgi:organic radical activating enzyme
MNYPVLEIFYSIQGEGAHVGMPAVFVRLAGCPLSCPFCDTPSRNDKGTLMSVAEIMSEINKYQSELVILTGGEPTMHDLTELVTAIDEDDRQIVIETNGVANPFPIMDLSIWVHYSVSPKAVSVSKEMYALAGSIKLLCGLETTADDILEQATMINSYGYPEILLQPIVDDGPYAENLTLAHTVNLCLQTGYKLSLQIHKILGVR